MAPTARISSLALIAIAGITTADAADFETNGVKISVSALMQSRIQIGSVDQSAGDGSKTGVDVNDSSEDQDPIEFSMRRVRIDLKAFKDGYKARFTFKDDDLGEDERTSDPNFHYAWIAKTIDHGNGKSQIKIGQDKAFFNRAWLNGAAMLFPQQSTNSLEAYAKSKNVGLSYRYSAELFTVGVDIQNYKDSDGDNDATTGETGKENGSLYTSARGEFTFAGLELKKWKDSYAGEDGTGLLLGVEFATSTASDVSGAKDDTTSFGIDGLFHMDALTAGFDFDFMNTGADDTNKMILTAQAAYAIDVDEELVVEPAVRVSLVDNPDKDDTDSTFKDESADEGLYLDIGTNLYFDGHNNFLQIAVQNFTAEGGDGSATIFRVQHQYKF